MTKRQIIRKARDEVKAGSDPAQVFEAYQDQFPKPAGLAMAIASVPREELKRRHKILNYFLLALLILAGIGKLFALLELLKGQPLALGIGISLLGLIVPVALAIEVARMNGQIYLVIPIFCIAGFLQVFNHYHGDLPEAIIDAAFIALVLVVDLVLKAKLFSNLKLSGVKKDAQGHYIF